MAAKPSPDPDRNTLIQALAHAIHTPAVGIHGCQAPNNIGRVPLRREPYFIGKHKLARHQLSKLSSRFSSDDTPSSPRNALLIRLDAGRTMAPPCSASREG